MMKRFYLGVVIVVCFSGCSLDQYKASFDAVSVGQNEQSVNAVMGEPDDVKGIAFAVPMIGTVDAQQMVWKSVFGQKTYAVVTYNGIVVGKLTF